jgi:hypothetical protein
MKKQVWASALAVLVAAGTLSLPASAQQSGDTGGQMNQRDENHDWGWVGLLGLAGLAGLKRRDREETHTHRTASSVR